VLFDSDNSKAFGIFNVNNSCMNIRLITLDEALPIRHCVLWPNKPTSFCMVDGDDKASHYGAFLDNALISVASIYIDGREARLRKFATLESFQGCGIGSKLIDHIVSQLKQADVETFWCDARTTAVGFYKRFGMEVQGAEFVKSGIAYYKMEVSLEYELY
jgi:ribosomal protein S18 acetylase RimI-like enzyme